MNERPPKLPELPTGCLFQVEVPQPAVMRQLVENISHVIKSVEFHIVADDEFEGLRVETLDDLKVCLVIGQLPCRVQVTEEWRKSHSASICLSVEWLLLMLRQIDLQYSLILEQFKDGEDIVRLRSFESLTGGDELVADLRSLVPLNSGTIKLKEFPVQFQIEMDLQTVRTFLKSCESIKSEDVEITVREHTVGDVTIETVTMKACEKATMALKRTFRGVQLLDTSNSDNISSSDTPSDGASPSLGLGCIIFQESFATKYLNNFVRSMNRTNVTFRMSPGNPLHVSYPFGTRDSSVTFILAPREDIS